MCEKCEIKTTIFGGKTYQYPARWRSPSLEELHDAMAPAMAKGSDIDMDVVWALNPDLVEKFRKKAATPDE